jgi:hypothetical protein
MTGRRTNTAGAKAAGMSDRVLSQDLPWLRQIFEVPSADQCYRFRGVVELDPAGGPNEVQEIAIRTPRSLASIERILDVEPVDAWSGRNSRFDVLYKDNVWSPARNLVDPGLPAGAGFYLVLPRNFAIRPGQSIVLRWTSLSAFGSPAWRYDVEGLLAEESLE